MNTIFISSKNLKLLTPISDSHPYVSKTLIGKVPYVVKRLDNNNKNRGNTIYTVRKLDQLRDLLPEEFCIPDYEILSEDGISAYATKELTSSIDLKSLLASPVFHHNEKIGYLKKFGGLLRKCDDLRRKRGFHHFAIGDVQEENILVVPMTGEVRVVDMDSCRIGNNHSDGAKYLTPLSMAALLPDKYRIFPLKADRNTDLYCYVIMILNYLTNKNIYDLDLREFNYLLRYLSNIGFSQELIQIFYGIIYDKLNRNPDYLLDTINVELLQKARRIGKNIYNNH